MVTNRLERFQTALDACVRLKDKYPEGLGLTSIIKQIEYLISLETGRSTDRSRLKDIVIGVHAAKEIEPVDAKLAELLYLVDNEAQRM